MPLRPASLLACCAIAFGLAWAGLAAADPSKQECVAANERAQALRQRESLQAARDELVRCLAATCPGPVRQDCAERLVEVERATPTFVFQVTDPTGLELTDVSLRVDGAVAAEDFAGHAVSIDPGSHQLVFSSPSGYALAESVVAHEGEKDRPERIVLRRVPSHQIQRIVGISAMGLGGAGIVVGSVLGIVAKATYDGALRDDCGGDARRCNGTGVSQVSAAHDQAAGATAGIVVGSVLAAGGVVLWATANRTVHLAPTLGGGGVRLGGTF